MNDQIAFSLEQLLAFGGFLIAVILGMVGIVIKLMRLGSSVKKIKNNDLTGFVNIGDFADFKAKFNREMGQLQADVKNIKGDVSSLEVRFEKHINQK